MFFTCALRNLEKRIKDNCKDRSLTKKSTSHPFCFKIDWYPMFPQIIVRKAFPSKPIICAMWIVNEELGGWVGVRDGGGGGGVGGGHLKCYW